MINYYSVLGVAKNADLDTIKRAYRAKAISCHPDNGGDSKEMKAVNEAWFVLRDPSARREFDSLLDGLGNGTQQCTENARREAQAQTATYPKSSKDLDHWINNVFNDFQSARYSSKEYLGDTMRFPTVEDSATAAIFLYIGAIVGFFIPITWPN